MVVGRSISRSSSQGEAFSRPVPGELIRRKIRRPGQRASKAVERDGEGDRLCRIGRDGVDLQRGAVLQERRGIGIERHRNQATDRLTGVELQRAVQLLVVDLERDAAGQGKTEGQRQRARGVLAGLGRQFDRQQPLAALLVELLMRQAADLVGAGDLAVDRPVAMLSDSAEAPPGSCGLAASAAGAATLSPLFCAASAGRPTIPATASIVMVNLYLIFIEPSLPTGHSCGRGGAA